MKVLSYKSGEGYSSSSSSSLRHGNELGDFGPAPPSQPGQLVNEHLEKGNGVCVSLQEHRGFPETAPVLSWTGRGLGGHTPESPISSILELVSFSLARSCPSGSIK